MSDSRRDELQKAVVTSQQRLAVAQDDWQLDIQTTAKDLADFLQGHGGSLYRDVVEIFEQEESDQIESLECLTEQGRLVLLSLAGIGRAAFNAALADNLQDTLHKLGDHDDNVPQALKDTICPPAVNRSSAPSSSEEEPAGSFQTAPRDLRSKFIITEAGEVDELLEKLWKYKITLDDVANIVKNSLAYHSGKPAE